MNVWAGIKQRLKDGLTQKPRNDYENRLNCYGISLHEVIDKVAEMDERFKQALLRISELEEADQDKEVIIDLQREQITDLENQLRVAQGQIQNLLTDARFPDLAAG